MNFVGLKNKGYDFVKIIVKDIKMRKSKIAIESVGLDELMKKTMKINEKIIITL